MSKFGFQLFKRRSIRLKNYRYDLNGLYFITICCHNQWNWFGTIENNKMILNEIGLIVFREWEQTINKRDNIILHEFIVMPNHFHAIIEIETDEKVEELVPINIDFKSPKNNLGSIIRGFKGSTSRQINNYLYELQKETGNNSLRLFYPEKIWQRSFYEHVIRDEESYKRITNYIMINPMR